jgi:hypothetical protein
MFLQPWPILVAEVFVENYASREAAFAAETAAINREFPLYQRGGGLVFDYDWVVRDWQRYWQGYSTPVQGIFPMRS